MRGVDIGTVSHIKINKDNVEVALDIERQYAEMIPANSVAEIYSTGLMGSVEIAIIQGDSEAMITPACEIEGRIKPDMFGELADKGSELMEGIGQTVDSVNKLLSINSENLTSFVVNLERMGSSINSIVQATAGNIDGAMSDIMQFTSVLAESADNVSNIVNNFDALTADVAERDIVTKLNDTLESLNNVLVSITEGEGTATQLITNKELYESLTEAGVNLGALLEDIKTNPKRYIHFSLFGGSKE
jgi:phospholipid/cholesterol/gamma-HCH transport system substrate-binding protein